MNGDAADMARRNGSDFPIAASESARKHADDREARSVQRNRLAEHTRIESKVPFHQP